MRTQAVVFQGVDQIEMLDIEMPPPGPNEVQVKTEYSIISAGIEGWCLQNLFTWAPTPYPVVPGCQRVGTDIAIGPGGKGSKVGDRVVVTVGSWKGTKVKPFWGSHAAVCNTVSHEIYKIGSSLFSVGDFRSIHGLLMEFQGVGSGEERHCSRPQRADPHFAEAVPTARPAASGLPEKNGWRMPYPFCRT